MPRRGLILACALLLATASGGAAASGAAAAPNPFYGVVGVHYPSQQELDQVAAAGGGTFRVALLWEFVEPRPGVRDFFATDRLFAMAARSGVTLLPNLYGVPKWVARNPNQPPIRRAWQRQAWGSLLTDFARRYGSNGTFWTAHPEIPKRPVTTWEIWNEPNLGGFFGGKPNPRGFARLLRTSAEGLRAGDPAARLLTGGVFPYHTLRNTMKMTRYLRLFYRVRGVSDSFDLLGIHPYAPEPRTVLHWVRVARRIMNAHGDAGKPIVISEFGWVTGGKRFKFSPLKSTLRKQAGRLTTTYNLFAANRAALGIESAIWFSYTDHDTPGGPDFWTDRAGLLRLDGKPKPAWFAFARVAGGTP